MCACLHIRPTAKGYVLHMCHTPLEEPVLSPVLTSWQCRHLFSTLPHWASHIHSQSPILQLYAARHAVRTGHRTGHCISVISWQLQYRQRTARKWKEQKGDVKKKKKKKKMFKCTVTLSDSLTWRDDNSDLDWRFSCAAEEKKRNWWK